MSESIRAWSLDNSLFSGGTGDTAATSASSSSQSKPLQVPEELEQNEVYQETIAQPQLEPTSGAIASAPSVPTARSLPLRAPAPAVKPARAFETQPLFGAPNIQMPLMATPATASDTAGRDTKSALAQLHLALGRLLDSVSIGRTSILVTRCASAAQLIEDYIPQVGAGLDSANESSDLTGIIRIVLAFTDCLVRGSSMRSTRMSLLHSLELLGTALGLVEPNTANPVTMPRNFSLRPDTLHSGLCSQIIDGISSSISEQEGAYVAPVCRGLDERFSVACLCIGMPHLSESHWTQVNSLMSACPELHIYARQDGILPAQRMRVVPPFRVPDAKRPPIGISLAPELAVHTSGTLGGYVYPIIDESDSLRESYRNSTFALTCGHVCIPDANAARNIDRPVMTPSPVLTAMFRRALDTEAKQHSDHTFEYQAYREAIHELDLHPPQSLGHLVWGERAVVAGKHGNLTSDMAIIKCNPDMQCRNYLGDDIELGSDLGLMFERTVTHVVPQELTPGLEVFKYGATTKHTSGVVSPSRMIYWSSNKLQSTEFVVRAETPVFASGGDSGAWILTRGKNTQSSGLGVVGMIHSYDGEFKEFGLYTPIGAALDRLHQVTNVPWAVVGVPSLGDDSIQVNSE